MVKISQLAADKLKETISKQKNPEKVMLRISFGGFGWGGPRLELALDELKNQNDIFVESEGITIVYGSDIDPYVCNSVIDYSNSWFERGFVIRGGRTSSC